jgi:hypothetical protein
MPNGVADGFAEDLGVGDWAGDKVGDGLGARGEGEGSIAEDAGVLDVGGAPPLPSGPNPHPTTGSAISSAPISAPRIPATLMPPPRAATVRRWDGLGVAVVTSPGEQFDLPTVLDAQGPWRSPRRSPLEGSVGARGVALMSASVTTPEAGRAPQGAHRLGLLHSTVKHHLANARSKVGAETTAQLVWILAPRLPEPEEGGAAGGVVAPSRTLAAGSRSIGD